VRRKVLVRAQAVGQRSRLLVAAEDEEREATGVTTDR
jgi:hypothetical protein